MVGLGRASSAGFGAARPQRVHRRAEFRAPPARPPLLRLPPAQTETQALRRVRGRRTRRAPPLRTRLPQLKEQGVAARAKVVEIVKELVTANAVEWGRFEFEETKIGRLDHKIEKLQIVKLVPGVEWLKPYGLSGDHGITLEEYTPFGVVAAILPVTHSSQRSAATSSTWSPPATRLSSTRIRAARARPRSPCAPTTRPSTPPSASRISSARSRSRRWNRSTR